MGRLLAQVLSTVSRNCIFLIIFDILITLSWSSPYPQSCKSELSALGTSGGKWVSPEVFHTVEEVERSLLSHSCVDINSGYFSLTLCCFGWEAVLTKLFLPSPMHPHSCLFFSSPTMRLDLLSQMLSYYLSCLWIPAQVNTLQFLLTRVKNVDGSSKCET